MRWMRNRYTWYILRRLAQAVPLIFIILTFNFFLIHAAPGDPVDVLTGQLDADPEYLEELRREFGLDQPLLTQFGRYIIKVARLDLGYSMRYRQDVFGIIIHRVPATLLLMGSALVLSTLMGIIMGTIAAQRPYGLSDNAATLIALAGYSMPLFWLGQILLLVFALKLNWFPTQGMYSLRAPSEGWGKVFDILKHLVLPAITYSFYYLTLIFRLTRVKMQEILADDFIVTARAKGVSEKKVIYYHALRTVSYTHLTLPTN